MYEQMDPGVLADRVAAVRDRGEAGLEALMRRVPALAEAVLGGGPVAVLGMRKNVRLATQDGVAHWLASSSATDVLILHTNRIEGQLLALAVWHGGQVSLETLAEETQASPVVLGRALDGLVDLVLVDPRPGWVKLRPGVMAKVPVPGRLLRSYASAYTTRELGVILSNLGVKSGQGKSDLIDAFEGALRDPDVLSTAFHRLDPDVLNVVERLIDQPVPTIPVSQLLHSQSRYLVSQALSQAVSMGLAGTDRTADHAWMWLDVLVTLQGGFGFDWSDMVQPGVVREDLPGPPTIPTAVSALDRVIGQFGASPSAALKTGGLGVTAIRATAKALRLPAPAVGLLTGLAIDLGLLTRVITGSRGRGRNQVVDEVWRPSDGVGEWTMQPAPRRWRQMVRAWLETISLPVDGKAVERYEVGAFDRYPALVRGVFARALAELSPGTAYDRGGISVWLSGRYHRLLPPDVIAQLLGEAAVLGLVAEAEPVIVTSHGAALLAGEDIEEVLAGGQSTFVVQADHSIVAPPDLSPDTTAMLERFTTLESDAGARLYRIDDHGITSAIDSGLEVDSLVEFLRIHSQTGLPQNVERTVRDAAARHGGIQVGSGITWIASDDPALISAAVGVRPAKLVAISPTAAVSDQSRPKVMQALRSAGLAALDTEAKTEAFESYWRPPTRSPDGIELFPTDIAGLAATVTAELTYELEPEWESDLGRLTSDMDVW